MKSKLILTIILVHFIVLSFSQEVVPVTYAVAGIAENLKKDANAVYRLEESILQVLSPSKYTLKVHKIITVLNTEGAFHLHQSLWFNKFNTIGEIEVKVYNSEGEEMHKFKKKDFSVENYYDGFSLATDDKLMRLSLVAPRLPCTVDVKYTIESSSYTVLPDGLINNAASSVEQFRYIVKVPDELGIRYRTVNMVLQPAIEDNGKEKVYTWETKNVAVNKVEAGSYDGNALLPKVEVSPNVFEYDGYKGGLKTWSEFGKWCYPLYEEKNPFSEQRVTEIKEMLKDQPDDASKIKVLYDYLQKNMRYVSIQFGIGGFRPFTSRFVDEKKYGDCKALTNYMRNLLVVAGIKSYPALINAGYDMAPASVEFPENIFNHVILCVPRATDTTWLECTSTNNEAGFLGDFTENKNSLLLTEKGGVMVRTPKSNYNHSVLTTVNEIFLNEEGGAEVNCRLAGTGNFFSLLDEVRKTELGKQNEIFVNYLHYKEPDEFHLTQDKQAAMPKQVSLHLIYTKLFDFKAGDKFFFPKSVNRLCNERLSMQQTRKADYLFTYPYKKVDTTIFHLPPGFKVDAVPVAKELSGECVFYKRDAAYDAPSNTLKIISTLVLKKNIIMPSQYYDLSVLFNTIEKEEANKLVLKKG